MDKFPQDTQKDFFISYSSADRHWAEWIAWQLEKEKKLSTILQAWDFRPSMDHIQEMQEATTVAKRTIVVLSPEYLNELYKHPEWTAAFAQNLKGKKGTLLPVRVRDCELQGLLAPIIPIDLTDQNDETAARQILFDGISLERAVPTAPPPFPGTARKTPTTTTIPTSSAAVGSLLLKQAHFPKNEPPIRKTLQVFYSYAQEDEGLRDDLEKHLGTLQRQGVIAGWHSGKISAGRERASEIEKYWNAAQIILLLVSANFIASDAYDVGEQAMERHEAGTARVIPIILRPVDWRGAPFDGLKVLPRNQKPITSWSNRDEAFLDVAQGIRNVVEEIVNV